MKPGCCLYLSENNKARFLQKSAEVRIAVRAFTQDTRTCFHSCHGSHTASLRVRNPNVHLPGPMNVKSCCQVLCRSSQLAASALIASAACAVPAPCMTKDTIAPRILHGKKVANSHFTEVRSKFVFQFSLSSGQRRFSAQSPGSSGRWTAGG